MHDKIKETRDPVVGLDHVKVIKAMQYIYDFLSMTKAAEIFSK